MSCLCRCHGNTNRLVITHFTKENHIRALAQGSTQGNQIIGSIRTDLALADDTAIMAVEIFQRILQSDDMAFPGMVDSVDQTGHGGGFTASGRTGNKDHATGIVGDVHHILGNGKLCRIR